jgi:hypothetical protein
MTEGPSLRELERKAYRSFFQDGLWDLCFGLLLLATGVGAMVSDTGSPGVHAAALALYFVPALILIAGKKWITVPRLGLVKFARQRRARLMRGRYMLAIFVLLGLAAWAVAAGTDLLARLRGADLLGDVLFALVFVVAFSLLAHFLDFRRLYLYAWLYGLALPAYRVLQSGPGSVTAGLAVFLPAAALMLLTGIVLLARFVRAYPLPPREAPNGNA